MSQLILLLLTYPVYYHLVPFCHSFPHPLPVLPACPPCRWMCALDGHCLTIIPEHVFSLVAGHYLLFHCHPSLYIMNLGLYRFFHLPLEPPPIPTWLVTRFSFLPRILTSSGTLPLPYGLLLTPPGGQGTDTTAYYLLFDSYFMVSAGCSQTYPHTCTLLGHFPFLPSSFYLLPSQHSAYCRRRFLVPAARMGGEDYLALLPSLPSQPFFCYYMPCQEGRKGSSPGPCFGSQ